MAETIKTIEPGLDAGSATLVSRLRVIGLVVGPALAGLILAFPPAGLSPEGAVVAALAALMAVWWATEAIPIAATALLPLIALPLGGVQGFKDAAAPYADPVVMLLLGGFIVALGIERSGLHRRLALNAAAAFGDRPRLMVLGFMAAAGLLSMWISNTATTLMMTPIALAAAAAAREGGGKFATALVLGVAYASSIGGIATPVGTPTNLIAMGWLERETGAAISFGAWMMYGVPVAALTLAASWFILTRGVPVRGGAEAFAIVKTERDALGVWRSAELRMAAVFATVALLWIFRPMVAEATGLKGLTDAGIAIAGAVAMFLVPAGRSAPGEALLTWPQAERLPWGVLLLFGGGLSLAAAMAATGVDQAIGGVLEPLAQAPDWVVILAIVALVIFLTELTSNVATITALLPVIGVIGAAAGIPAAALAVPAAAAASCAFMLPVATAPNAIAFGTRAVSVAQMATNGFWLNLCGIAIIAGLAATLGRSFYG